jgi:hypothetical protein
MVSDWPTTAPNSSDSAARLVALGVALYAICVGVGRLVASQFGDDAKNNQSETASKKTAP